jgi:hypothetical protein
MNPTVLNSCKYNYAKIYRLTDGVLNYYGSTCGNLASRKAQHRSQYINNKKNYTSSFKIFESGLPVDIILVENVKCQNIDELRKAERAVIESNDCVNLNIPGRTNKEWSAQKFECIECSKCISRGYQSDHRRRRKHKRNASTDQDDSTIQ